MSVIELCRRDPLVIARDPVVEIEIEAIGLSGRQGSTGYRHARDVRRRKELLKTVTLDAYTIEKRRRRGWRSDFQLGY